jgi:hypothetical protein
MIDTKFILPGWDRVFTVYGEFLGFHIAMQDSGNGNVALSQDYRIVA